tara:strand:- start:58 stop:312 length:255 start_codon:yes stop_codon:yes gene_type:complete
MDFASIIENFDELECEYCEYCDGEGHVICGDDEMIICIFCCDTDTDSDTNSDSDYVPDWKDQDTSDIDSDDLDPTIELVYSNSV